MCRGQAREHWGSLWLAIENCCLYRERSVYTTCKVKQIDPGCRFRRVFVRLPVNLPACHLQSLSPFLIRPFFSLSLSLLVCVHGVCVCVFVSVCVALLMFSCIFHADARPGSREALRKIPGRYAALFEAGHTLLDTFPTI